MRRRKRKKKGKWYVNDPTINKIIQSSTVSTCATSNEKVSKINCVKLIVVYREEAKQYKAERMQLLSQLKERDSEIEQLNKR